MKTKTYYTSEDLNNMTTEELKELVRDMQAELENSLWRMHETKELLIAAIQTLPKKNKP